MRVDESIVIFGPMDHVGWASASSTVTSASSARLLPRNGPPLAVRTMRRTSSGDAAALRHWWIALCSESTGTISAPGVRLATCTTGPAAINDSLLARASRRPACGADSVTGSPAKPTTPFTTTSATEETAARASGPATSSVPGGSRAASSRARVSSARATTGGRSSAACSARRSTDERAPRATTSYRPGSARTTSTACVPIDPVEPTRLTVVIE